MAKRRSKGDVSCLLPNKKKSIAYSTKAASDLIVILAQEYNTIQEVYNAINYDAEAKGILQLYIDHGYGGYCARDLFG